jgi:hypothetical protein
MRQYGKTVWGMVFLLLIVTGCASAPPDAMEHKPEAYQPEAPAPAAATPSQKRAEEGGIGGTGRSKCSSRDDDDSCPERLP